MKTKKLLTLLTAGVLATTALVACSSNQKADKSTHEAKTSQTTESKLEPIVKGTEQSPSQYGFMQVANDSTERLWFVSSKIAKDSELHGVYAIKNGKATYYYLGTTEIENTGNVAYLKTDYSLTFADIENLSNSEIIKKAQKLDKEAYLAQSKLVNEYLTDYESKGPLYQGVYAQSIEGFEVETAETFNQLKSQISDFDSDKGYQKYRKQVTEQTIIAAVKTDDSGNNVNSEKIELKAFEKLEIGYDEGFYVYNSRNSSDYESLSLDVTASLHYSMDFDEREYGTVLKSNYQGFDGLVTRDFSDGNITFDKTDTKNIVEQ
ncbi:hypothetical protein ACTGXY_06215 [Streptococcus suis]